ncbi:MAG: T9SS type A sorting domain-containing protein [Bacteroidia bacterium]|nr:T9SS type A sorting domain-containing protein [Bacteroidia bacterium]NNF31752.1 T9SS type A sorting domain-containing protein [Flavobacteriaceae bacterium]NNK55266.1 T9SS type A sorting domain-containing protein [Flavobacteriaceae bacterium]NNM10261.1 T9SS type A sorting domain-containing protein [Flavobacteriaceae bacterium]
MKQFYLLMAGLIGMVSFSNAQVTIDVDANDPWEGFMNVFEIDCSTFVFNSGWAVEDLKTEINTGANTITLKPNFNTYCDDPTDPFWVNQTTGEGNKCMDANTLVADNTLLGQEITFQGFVVSNDLDAGYTTKAYIKVFNADFSVLKEESAPLVAGENFVLNYTNVETEDANVQYGFQVLGRNANCADEPTLGSVVVTQFTLGVDDVNAVNISVFPNPTTDQLNISANETITNITIYNLLGQVVLQQTQDTSNVTLDVSQLPTGNYIARVATDSGSQNLKVVKR